MNKTVLGIIVFLVVLGGIGGFLLVSSSRPSSVPVEAQNIASSPSATPGGNVKEFTVEGTNFAFSPTEITVNKGDTVKITFKDNDGMHNLVIDGYKLSTNIISGGSQDTVQFVADKAGSFEYYCSVANHRDQGMSGTLVVN